MLQSTRKIHIILCIILSSSIVFIYVLNRIIANLELTHLFRDEYIWVLHGFMNILGYMTLFLPGYLIYKYIHSINYLSLGADGSFVRLIRACFADEENVINLSNSKTSHERTTREEVILLLFHFVGLQLSYLTWGVLQEKVMTQKYDNSELFKDSQFLVFVNRVLAFGMSGLYLLYQKQTRYKCPLYKYTFCSFSNIMSSWCQYEALKYVSFPHQVLAKAAKTIPVMIMGRIVSKTKYEYYEYVTSVILSIGMLLFMLDAGNDRADSAMTTFAGAILLILYIVFDSFTSTWQGALFKTYQVRPIQMMCFVNFFSCIFTLSSLIQQGSFFYSINFMYKYPQFITDCFILSVCSATGQLFIFSTISKFGPLVFAIITTIRQGFSILLSCIIYKHQLYLIAVFGLVLVFTSILLRIYCGHRFKQIKKNMSVRKVTV